MGEWRPIERGELEGIIREDLVACAPEQRAVFERCRMPLCKAPIERYGKLEYVFIVAQRGDEVMYFEDIDAGFNFSPLDAEGKILQHWSNQDELMNTRWHRLGRPQEDRPGPAEPLPDDWSFLLGD
jgi:hypothetical protein